MFTEPQPYSRNAGWLEVVCGCMFSGKTEELIRRLKRAEFAGLRVEIFKPSVDTRYSNHKVVSHNNTTINSTPVSNSNEILMLANNVQVVGLDEVQFFDDNIVHVAQTLANKGLRVVAAGLDMDYLAQPFGPMPQLLTLAEYVTKLHAICVSCGSLASYSHRLQPDEENQLLLGEKDKYEPLCRKCYNEKTKKL